MHLLKKLARWLAILLLFFVLLFVVIWGALQFPAVQTKVVQRLTTELSNTLHTKVSIDRVDISFFKTLQLEGIYIEDLRQDTLLYAGQLQASIGLFSLANSKITLNNVSLQKAKLRLNRPADQEAFNFDFLLDAFASTDSVATAPTSTAAEPWQFLILQAQLEGVDFQLDDRYAGVYLQTTVADLLVSVNEMNLNNQLFRFEDIRLRDSEVLLAMTNPSPLAELRRSQQPPDTTPVQFPYTGWELAAENISLSNNTLTMVDVLRATPDTFMQADARIDLSDIQLSAINLEMEKVQWTPDILEGNISTFNFVERSGFEMTQLEAQATLTPFTFELRDLQIKTPKSQLTNNSQLEWTQFSDLSTAPQNITFTTGFGDSYIDYGDIRYWLPENDAIPFLDISTGRLLHLSGQLSGSLQQLNTETLLVEVDDVLRLQLSGQINQLNNPKQLNLDISLDELSTSYNQAITILKDVNLPKALQDFGVFTLRGNMKGSLDELQVAKLSLETEASTGFEISGILRHLSNVAQLEMDLSIDRLFTVAEDVDGFVKNGLPPMLDTLGQISYQGLFKGTLHCFDLDGKLSTALGQMESDLFVNFNKAYTSATYNGDVSLTDFQLGRLLADSLRVGDVTLKGNIQGEGFVPDSMTADIDVLIASIVYQNYEYKNIVVDGLLDKGVFLGELNLDDPNARLDFDGRVSFTEERPEYDFRMQVDTLNLQALNLSKIPLRFHVNMDMNFTGRNINDFDGRIVLTEVYISDSLETFQTDSFRLFTEKLADDERVLSIVSSFLTGNVEGDFNLPELPDLLFAYMNAYFPLNQATPDSEDSTGFDDVQQRQRFTMQLDLIDARPIMLFVPQLELLNKATLRADFDSQEKILNINVTADRLRVSGATMEEVIFISKGDNNRLTSELEITELMHTSGTDIPQMHLTNRMGNDSMYFDLRLENDTTDQLLRTAATVTPLDKLGYKLVFAPTLVANNKEWSVNKNNEVRFGEDQLRFQQLMFSYAEQSFSIQSEQAAPGESIPPVKVVFDDFQIKTLSNIANVENTTFDGRLNGFFLVSEPLDNLHFTSDLKIPDLKLNERSAGALSLDLEQLPNSKLIDVSVLLKSEVNDFRVTGNYDISSTALDLEADVKSLELRIVDPILVGLITESEGFINGSIAVQGNTQKPEVSGTLKLNQISTIVDFTQARYAIAQGNIVFNNEEIDFGTKQLTDEKGNQATLSGKIKHRFFSDLRYDLSLTTDQFTILKTTAENNELFYGNLLLEADVRVSGPVNIPLVEVNARTLANSDFNLSVFAGQEGFDEENFILFASPRTYDAARANQEQLRYDIKNNFPAEIRLTLEVTDDALFRMIIDPATGDQLECRGNSDLQVNFLPSGAIEMYGSYVIRSGQYRFSYTDVIRRNFDINAGSSVLFNGDPLNARLNVSAKYQTQATPYELISNQATLSAAEVSFAQKKQNVNVLLYMKGGLLEPELNFDIQLPGAEGSLLSSEIQRKLAELRNDHSELNKQVFGLLLLNSFISSDATTGFASAGESAVLGSVSKFVSGQLNKLADKYVKGVQINFDINSYSSQYLNSGAGGTVTALGVGVSKDFGDRLSVKASGNFDLNSTAEATGFSQFAGNFVLEYKLTPSGNYLLKVFRKSDYDILNDENAARNGVGVSFSKSFGNKQRKKVKETKN